MRLSHERCVHLSHLVINLLEDDDQVGFLRDANDIRLKILQIIEGEMTRQEEVEEGIRRRIATQRRDIPEGSAEWEVLYQKTRDEVFRRRFRLS